MRLTYGQLAELINRYPQFADQTVTLFNAEMREFFPAQLAVIEEGDALDKGHLILEESSSDSVLQSVDDLAMFFGLDRDD